MSSPIGAPVSLNTKTYMPFLKPHAEQSAPDDVFNAYPQIYRHWAEMGQQLINGPSPLTPGKRARTNAEHRAKAGYVGLYPKLDKK